MEKIYKYEVPILWGFDLELPINAKILSFQCQKTGKSDFAGYVWILVNIDKETEKETRHFRLLSTGYDVDSPQELEFIGTIQMENDEFDWHLFEIKKGYTKQRNAD